MDLINHINLPRSSSESILFLIGGESHRVYLIHLKELDQEGMKSKFVSSWNCWYLNSEDYYCVKRERGNINNIRKAFANSEQVILP